MVLAFFNVARRWVAYRTGAEMLKAEAYLYAAGAEKYNGDNRDDIFEQRMTTITKLVQDLRSGKGDQK